MNAMAREFSNDVESLRLPPQSVESEQSVIGGLIMKNEAFADISDWLSEDDFFRHDHRLIYRSIKELLDDSKPVDVITLGEWLEDNGLGTDTGGGSYVIQLASTIPSAANIVAYAEIVKEKSLLRQAVKIGTDLVNSAFATDGSTSREITSETLTQLQEISGGARPNSGPRNLASIGKTWFASLQERYNHGGEPIGLPLPWPDLNSSLSGLQGGLLYVIAARPSMGKSAIAVNILNPLVSRGKHALFFNLEMTGESIYSRSAAAMYEIPLDWFRNPAKDDDQWSKASLAVKDNRERQLTIDDTAGLTIQQIVSRVKRVHMRNKIDLLVIDHLHIIALAGKTRPDIEIGQITLALKKVAKSLNIPVVLLAQLNRGLEARTNKHPAMADLRESGSIEQDADVVMFLYRDDYYAAQEERESAAPGIIEINVAKQRDGSTGTFYKRFVAEFGLVKDTDDRPLKKEIKGRSGLAGRDKASGGDK